MTSCFAMTGRGALRRYSYPLLVLADAWLAIVLLDMIGMEEWKGQQRTHVFPDTNNQGGKVPRL